MKKWLLQYFMLLLSGFLLIGLIERGRPVTVYADNRKPPVVINIVGEFYSGGNILVIKADHTFKYSQNTDAGPDANWSGTYQYQNNVVMLRPSHDIGKAENETKIIDGYGKEIELKRHWYLRNLTPIRWGSRLYLLSDTEMLDFCNAINLGKEPRGNGLGNYFMRESQAELRNLPAVAGFPFLPKPWRAFLLSKAVTGKVIGVLHKYVHADWKGKLPGGVDEGEINAITIRAGSHKGLKPGMVFNVPIILLSGEAVTTGVYAVVREVKPDKCLAEFAPHSNNFRIKEGTFASTRLERSIVESFQHPPKPEIPSVVK